MSDFQMGGPLHFRHGPSCFWIVTAPLYFVACVVFSAVLSVPLWYGLQALRSDPSAILTVAGLSCAGLLWLGFSIFGLRRLYKWGKAFRFWSVTFDRVQQTVSARWGLFVPLRVRQYLFAEIEALQLGRKTVRGYRGRSYVVYPVHLLLSNGRQPQLLEYTDFFQARRMAEEAARYADSAVDRRDGMKPPQFNRGVTVLRANRCAVEPGVGNKPLLPPAPHGSRCQISWEDEAAAVRLSYSGWAGPLTRLFKFLSYVGLVGGVPLVLLGWLTGDWQKWGSLALLGVLWGVAPLGTLIFLVSVFFTIRTTTITVDSAGLHYHNRALLRGSTRHIPHGELKSIRLDGKAVEILTLRKRLRVGEQLSATERAWLCESLNKLAVG